MRLAAVIIIGLVIAPVSACSSPGAPDDAVERFYAAIAAGDCAAAKAELSTAYRAELEREAVSCAALIEEMRRFRLEAVLATTVDGRNRDARLVRVRLSGRKLDVVIRVQMEGGRWKIFAM